MLLSLHTSRLSLPHATAGFVLLSDKIQAVHRAINPEIFLSDADNLEQTAVNAAAPIGRKVKSSFTKGLGKRKKLDDENVNSLSTMKLAATRHAVHIAITPSSPVLTSAPLTSTTSTSATLQPATLMSTTPMQTAPKRHNTGVTVTPATTSTVHPPPPVNMTLRPLPPVNMTLRPSAKHTISQ